jgi:hypothetical protein
MHLPYQPWNRTGHVHVHYKSAKTQERIITDDMKASAEVSAKRWNDYVVKWQPTEKKAIADKAGSSDAEFAQKTGALQSQMRGTTNADIAQAKAGVALPAGGNVEGSLTKGALLATDLGRRSAGAMVESTENATDRKASELGAITGLGQDAQEGISNTMGALSASSAQNALAKAQTDQAERFAKDAANRQLMSSAANLAVTGMSAYGGGTSTPGAVDYSLGKEVAPTATQGGYSQSYNYPSFKVV